MPKGRHKRRTPTAAKRRTKRIASRHFFTARRLRKKVVTDVISRRGRPHIMAAPAVGQPITAQEFFLQSTAIDAFSYDPRKQILEITFVQGGTYWFFAVPPDVWGFFRLASSKGRFFHKNIYGHWSGRKGNRVYHPRYNYRRVR